MTSSNDATSGILYERLDSVERLEYYRLGGYHPVKIGDEFQGRYRVVHKLGYGSFSTTWLVYDQHFKSYLAIKTCNASSDPEHEINILSSLTNARSHSLTGTREEDDTVDPG